MKKAEFGSVAFFRRIIALITAAIIIVLIAVLIFTFNKLGKVKDDLEYYKTGSAASTVMIEDTAAQDGEHFDYELLFPDMYVDAPSERTRLYDAERFAYLTFTGGPSETTEAVLDVLKGQGISATFFIYGGDSEEGRAIIKRIVDEGHSIGVYGYALPQKKLYADIDTYLKDFNKEFQLIYETTGVKPDIFRFPGGTTNKFNAVIRQQLCSEMLRRGFTYYDWNCTGGDNIAGVGSDSIAQTAIETGGEKQRVFMMLHDTAANTATARALPYIIEHFRDAGYEFKAITNDIQPMAFE